MPSADVDIRLGDVVVSKPTVSYGGLVQYDFIRSRSEGHFLQTGMLNRPPRILSSAVSELMARQLLKGSTIGGILSETAVRYPHLGKGFEYPGQKYDQLFEAEYYHTEAREICDNCDDKQLVLRKSRRSIEPLIHYGLIASGNRVIKHGTLRDRWAQETGVLCFEMEAAGLMNSFPCLIIRGICDYADSHKNKLWQGYAAATAAAYAKELTHHVITGGHRAISAQPLERFTNLS